MMSRLHLPRTRRWAGGLSLSLAALTLLSSGATRADQLPDSSASPRQQLLAWMEEYLSDPVLLEREQVDEIKKKIESMSAEDVQRFLIETQRLRDVVESPDWQETRQWLRQFLRVQAIYSDEEIEELRQRIPEMTPDEMIALMAQIRDKHETLRGMHARDTQNRNSTLLAVENYRKFQAEAANRASQQRRGGAPLFGGGSGGSSHGAQRQSWQLPARVSIGAFGGGWGGW